MSDQHPKATRITSPDLNAERLTELRRLFPDLFGAEGQLDEQALQRLAHPSAPTGATGIERFRFEWAGKQESKRRAFTPSRATLVADKARSVNFDNTHNLIIEGDNLEVLKLLQATYFEQVKCIYIDPPYNTGNDFIYPDNYTEGKQAYWQGNGIIKDGVKLTALTESDGRKHSKWLNMMQSRLLLARLLLRQDGVIVISISDAEIHNLRQLCNQVFGEDSMIGCVVWNSTKSVTNTALISVSHTYNLIYAKNKNYFIENRPHFRLPEDGEGFANPDNDPRGHWKADPFQVGGERPNQLYPITNPTTGDVYRPSPGNSWKNELTVFKHLIADNRIVFGATGEAGPQRKRFLSDSKKRGKVAKTLWNDVDTTTNATQSLKKLMRDDVFDNPKPVNLIKRFIQLGGHDPDPSGAIIMDFFAGSGTAGQAVMELNVNASEGRNIRYILVQVPESIDEKHPACKAGYNTISKVCIERVKRAGEQIKEAHPDSPTDTGFRVYRLANSHFPENLFTADPSKSAAENLAALKVHLKTAGQARLFNDRDRSDTITEISLKNGYGLFFTLVSLKDAFPANTVQRLSGNGKSTLLCLDAALEETTVAKLTEHHFNDQLMVSKDALSTATTWCLQRAFGDNLRTL